MAFEVRGEYQVVEHVRSRSTTLHDPLLTTLLDFNRRALDQLTHALHVTVTYTYKKAEGIDKKTFFKGEEDKAVDPSKRQAGRDVYYLLKHIKYQRDFYAKVLKQPKDDVLATVEFLEDEIRNRMAHQTYLGCDDGSTSGCELRKIQTTERCFAQCIQLLQWIVEASYYPSHIKGEVKKNQNNITKMNNVFEDFKIVKQSIKFREDNDFETDTDKAIERLEKLLLAVREEQENLRSIEDRPLTHFINMVVSPRLNELW